MTASPSPHRRTPAWWVPVMIVAIAAVAIVLVLVVQRPESPSGTAAPPPASATPTATEVADPPTAEDAPTAVGGEDAPDLSAAERRDPEDLLAYGDVDAPVVLVVFSDYQCPYCAKWSADTLPTLREYAEAGDLRIEFRDVNVFGDASVRGSRAAYAAAMQGEFTAMHDALFADGMARAGTQLTDDALLTLAADLGLDASQFEEDYRSQATADEVARNQQLGLDLGVYSTPAFVLDGQPIVGAQPTAVFVDLLDAALESAPRGD
ncbi:DsbA family protein [Demequina muriae]|uniref:Thioredoxin domain-containing protein n=1 Tax=Demequina muriae TaxID=3051664 RepID=A0ABT8GDK0_9MICO|nr:thioredoxin domain-containing protein [Demequina sp. EGI L300058]MDN4479502.1 thioredoxin domain-containing protein [Demequina sp. EGI L300058]